MVEHYEVDSPGQVVIACFKDKSNVFVTFAVLPFAANSKGWESCKFSWESITVKKWESMSKCMVWKLVAAAFVLNAIGLLWIRNELVNADRSSEQGRQIQGLQVMAFEPNQRVERADRLLVVFNRDLVPDGMIGQPLGWTPFVIEPKAEGIW